MSQKGSVMKVLREIRLVNCLRHKTSNAKLRQAAADYIFRLGLSGSDEDRLRTVAHVVHRVNKICSIAGMVFSVPLFVLIYVVVAKSLGDAYYTTTGRFVICFTIFVLTTSFIQDSVLGFIVFKKLISRSEEKYAKQR